MIIIIIIIIIKQFVRRRNMSVDITRAPYRQSGNFVDDTLKAVWPSGFLLGDSRQDPYKHTFITRQGRWLLVVVLSFGLHQCSLRNAYYVTLRSMMMTSTESDGE